VNRTDPDVAEPVADRDVVTARPNGTGVAAWSMGSLYERLVSAAETGGQLGMSIVTQPPGMSSPLHVHTREAEAWFILEGTLTYLAGTEVHELGSGDFIYLPSNVPHAFRTTGSKPVRFLGLTVPGQLLDLYDEVGTPALERRLPDGGVSAGDIARWNELAPKYGLRIVGPPISETS
jgi:mannose-6-phosphate isomerase-like protein (cupin superfamily)